MEVLLVFGLVLVCGMGFLVVWLRPKAVTDPALVAAVSQLETDLARIEANLKLDFSVVPEVVLSETFIDS